MALAFAKYNEEPRATHGEKPLSKVFYVRRATRRYEYVASFAPDHTPAPKACAESISAPPPRCR